jgi:hypothetical protein
MFFLDDANERREQQYIETTPISRFPWMRHENDYQQDENKISITGVCVWNPSSI